MTRPSGTVIRTFVVWSPSAWMWLGQQAKAASARVKMRIMVRQLMLMAVVPLGSGLSSRPTYLKSKKATSVQLFFPFEIYNTKMVVRDTALGSGCDFRDYFWVADHPLTISPFTFPNIRLWTCGR